MANELTTFELDGTQIEVVDVTARANASAAQSTANSASSSANSANTRIDALEKLSRVSVSYSESTKTMTITTGNHNV